MGRNLVINTVFDPFTYDQMIAPVKEATDRHIALEAAYGELQDKADQLAGRLNEIKDETSYKTYNNYIDQLREQAKLLGSQGLQTHSASDALALKSLYNQKIIPIERAAARKSALIEEARQAMQKDPSLFMERDPNSLSVDEIVENPDMGYGRIYSGAKLTEQVRNALTYLSKQLTSTPVGQLDSFTNYILQNHGVSAADVLEAISNPSAQGNAQLLNSIAYDIIKGTGMPDWGNWKDIQDQVWQRAHEGYTSAIGESNMSTFDNYGARLAAQTAASRRASKGGGESDEEESKDGYIREDKGYSVSTEDTPAMKKRLQFEKFYKQGLIKQNADGTWRFTAAGQKMYQHKDGKITNEFQKFVLDNGNPMPALAYNSRLGDWGRRNSAKVMTHIWNSIKDVKVGDATRYTEAAVQLTDEQYTKVKEGIMITYPSASSKIPILKPTTGGKFTNSGKSIEMKDVLADPDSYSVIGVSAGEDGQLQAQLATPEGVVRVSLQDVYPDLASQIQAYKLDENKYRDNLEKYEAEYNNATNDADKNYAAERYQENYIAHDKAFNNVNKLLGIVGGKYSAKNLQVDQTQR